MQSYPMSFLENMCALHSLIQVGALIQWCVDTLTKKEKEEAKVRGISVNELLEGESASPTGLLVLPHFCRCGDSLHGYRFAGSHPRTYDSYDSSGYLQGMHGRRCV
jgi:hypothetical protein